MGHPVNIQKLDRDVKITFFAQRFEDNVVAYRKEIYGVYVEYETHVFLVA